jgi:hypothetical protein
LNPVVEKGGSDENLYKPYPELGKDGVYKALIRFVPNVFNLKKSKIHKYYVWLKDPADGKSFPVDCPSTVGKKSILKDVYWKLQNSPSAKDKELSKSFSRKEDYYALIQVVEDKMHPELEGKIMIFKFGKKVNDLIEQQIKPAYGKSCSPFDPIDGKNFLLHVRKVGEWNNYDLCSFVGEREPIIINGKPLEKTEAGSKMFIEHLKKGPSDLEKYDYKEWTEEVRDRVHAVIRNTVPDGRMISEILGSAGSSKSSYSEPKSETRTSSKEEMLSGASLDEEIPFEAPAKKSSKTASSSLEDLYADL